MQKRVGEEMINIFNSLLLKADSESGLEELGDFLQEEEDFEIFLEVVAPLMRVNYQVHANILENKILQWIPQYEVVILHNHRISFKTYLPQGKLQFLKTIGPKELQVLIDHLIIGILAFCIYIASAAVGARYAVPVIY
jgi:hypothetical protein